MGEVIAFVSEHNGNSIVYHYMYDHRVPPDGLRFVRECHLAMGKGVPPILEKDFEAIPSEIKDYLLLAERRFSQGYSGKIEVTHDLRVNIFKKYPRT